MIWGTFWALLTITYGRIQSLIGIDSQIDNVFALAPALSVTNVRGLIAGIGRISFVSLYSTFRVTALDENE